MIFIRRKSLWSWHFKSRYLLIKQTKHLISTFVFVWIIALHCPSWLNVSHFVRFHLITLQIKPLTRWVRYDPPVGSYWFPSAANYFYKRPSLGSFRFRWKSVRPTGWSYRTQRVKPSFCVPVCVVSFSYYTYLEVLDSCSSTYSCGVLIASLKEKY